MPPRTVRSMASKRKSMRPYRRPAKYAPLKRIPRGFGVNPAFVYKMTQNQYPTYLTKQIIDPTGTFTSSNSNVITLGTPIASAYIVNTYNVAGTICFRLSNINGSLQYREMFDQFRIAGAKVTITPQYNSANMYESGLTSASPTSNNSFPLPVLTICRDYDDTNNPTDELELLERQDVQIKRLDQPVVLYMKPKPRVVAATNVTSGGVISQGVIAGSGKEWIDVGSYTTAYPGFKFAINNLSLAAAAMVSFRVDTKLYLEFKNVR